MDAWLRNCIIFKECNNHSQYAFIDEPQNVPINTLLTESGSEIMPMVTTTTKTIEFDRYYCDENIYQGLLDIINNDNVITYKNDIYGLKESEISKLLYEYIVFSVNKLYHITNGGEAFLIMNEHYYNLLNSFNKKLGVSLDCKFIIDDDIDYIIVGRKADLICENTLVCFHNNYNMKLIVTSENVYNNYVKLEFYNSIERRKTKIKKLLQNAK